MGCPYESVNSSTVIYAQDKKYRRLRIFDVIDKINARVQIFDTIGNYLTGWGSAGKGPEQLNQPEDLAIDSKGQIYVTDTRNSRIQILERRN